MATRTKKAIQTPQTTCITLWGRHTDWESSLIQVFLTQGALDLFMAEQEKALSDRFQSTYTEVTPLA